MLIFDEVQCGLGRTGSLFAYQALGVEPDIITLAKPIAGGLPMGAILLREHIATAIKPGDHATTFGGGLLVSTVALSVVNRIAEPAFLQEVSSKSDHLANLLGRLLAHPSVQQVRGLGLMWGVELNAPAAPVQARALENGLLVTLAGERVIRLLPPLTITCDRAGARHRTAARSTGVRPLVQLRIPARQRRPVAPGAGGRRQARRAARRPSGAPVWRMSSPCSGCWKATRARGSCCRGEIQDIYRNVREFIVAVDENDQVVGCGGLRIYTPVLGEIVALAVDENVPRSGCGPAHRRDAAAGCARAWTCAACSP